MALTGIQERAAFGATARKDAWWLQPLLIFLGFSAFIVYSTWAAYQNAHYTFGPYLSPFYAPEIFGSSPHAWFRFPESQPGPDWWPTWMRFSPSLLVLWAPGLFRFTCYYYRGSYYKAFWADPIACSVGEPRNKYLGERSFPLILQNVHRYFFYIAAVFIVLLSWDVWKAMWFEDASGAKHFGLGLGTLIMLVNVFLIAGYTFSCHSFRHLIGGSIDILSAKPVRLKSWKCVSCINAKHGNFAWYSLFSVGFTDVYIRLCSMGIWHDWRIL